MNKERPGSPSVTTVAPASKWRSTSIETRRSRLASGRPPKKGVASKNAFRSGELTAIGAIYSRRLRRQAGEGGALQSQHPSSEPPTISVRFAEPPSVEGTDTQVGEEAAGADAVVLADCVEVAGVSPGNCWDDCEVPEADISPGNNTGACELVPPDAPPADPEP